ncbi:translational elongation factor EF-1 alpha [Ceratobasidium sp. 394]|nr:translational elongation factor EF-1 alpha [Ceratobasidium sp. 394]
MAPSNKKVNAVVAKNTTRNRFESSRLKTANAAQAAIVKARADKKQGQVARRQQRKDQNDEDLLVEQEQETERERLLREKALALSKLSADLQRQLDCTRAQLLEKQASTVDPPPPIPRPKRLTGFEIPEFRDLTGLSAGTGDLDIDDRWLAILAIVRDLIAKSDFDMGFPIGKQDAGKFGTATTVIYDLIPELQPCVNNWGAEYLLKSRFTHRRGHLMDKARKRRVAKERQGEGKGKQRAQPQRAKLVKGKGHRIIAADGDGDDGEGSEHGEDGEEGDGEDGNSRDSEDGRDGGNGGDGEGGDGGKGGEGMVEVQALGDPEDDDDEGEMEAVVKTLKKLASNNSRLAELGKKKDEMLAKKAADDKERAKVKKELVLSSSSHTAELEALKSKIRAREKAERPVALQGDDDYDSDNDDDNAAAAKRAVAKKKKLDENMALMTAYYFARLDQDRQRAGTSAKAGKAMNDGEDDGEDANYRLVLDDDDDEEPETYAMWQARRKLQAKAGTRVGARGTAKQQGGGDKDEGNAAGPKAAGMRSAPDGEDGQVPTSAKRRKLEAKGVEESRSDNDDTRGLAEHEQRRVANIKAMAQSKADAKQAAVQQAAYASKAPDHMANKSPRPPPNQVSVPKYASTYSPSLRSQRFRQVDTHACYHQRALQFILQDKRVLWGQKEVIESLDFNNEHQGQAIGSLSNGRKMKHDLARAMLFKADILLLDELTNYSDVVLVPPARHLSGRANQLSRSLIAHCPDRSTPGVRGGVLVIARACARRSGRCATAVSRRLAAAPGHSLPVPARRLLSRSVALGSPSLALSAPLPLRRTLSGAHTSCHRPALLIRPRPRSPGHSPWEAFLLSATPRIAIRQLFLLFLPTISLPPPPFASSHSDPHGSCQHTRRIG